MFRRPQYRIEHGESGNDLIVTGRWTSKAEKLVSEGAVDGLVLNYALGFNEKSLDFLGHWPISRLNVLDRSIVDLDPIRRLQDTLWDLSIEAAPTATLNLGETRLRALAGEWDLIRDQVQQIDSLEQVITVAYDESDLLPFRDQTDLGFLMIKDARRLRSLTGAEHLQVLETFVARGVPTLEDIASVANHVSLTELTFETARRLEDIEDVRLLTRLKRLGIENSGSIASLRPLENLTVLESLSAWGTTRVLDDDLAPLVELTALSDLRMKPRSSYRPSLEAIKALHGISD